VTHRSSEQVSFAIYKTLGVRDRRLVDQWRERTGCDWATALLSSGVMAQWRRTPEQVEREERLAAFDAAVDARTAAPAPWTRCSAVGKRANTKQRT
jgi:hypothetical protein